MKNRKDKIDLYYVGPPDKNDIEISGHGDYGITFYISHKGQDIPVFFPIGRNQETKEETRELIVYMDRVLQIAKDLSK